MKSVARPLASNCLCVLAVLSSTFAGRCFGADEREPGPKLVAQPEVLTIVPEDVLAVQVVSDLSQSNKRLKALAAKFGNEEIDLLALLKQLVSEGLDEKGSLAIAWVAVKGAATPAPVAFVPVTDFEAFLKPLGPQDAGGGIWSVQVGVRTALAANKGKFAVMTLTGQEQLLREVLAAKRFLSDPVAAMGLWRANQDFGAIATPQGIKLFVNLATNGVKQIQRMLAANKDPQMKAAAAMMDVYLQLLVAMETEVTYAAGGSHLDVNGSARMNVRIQLAKDGQLAKSLASMRLPKKSLLEGLPEGDFVAAGGATFSKSYIQEMMNFSAKMMKAMPQIYGELTDEQLKKMMKLWGDLADWESMSMVFSVPQADEPMMAGVAAIVRVSEADAFLKKYAAALREFSDLIGENVQPGIPAMKVDELKVGSHDALRVTMKMNLPEEANFGLERMYGPGGEVVTYLAAADKKTVAFGYVSKENLKRVMASINKPGLAADEGIVTTELLLAKDPHAVFYLSPKGIVELVRFFAAAAPPGAPVFDLPDFPATPPAGIAVQMNASSIDAEAVLPDELLTALGDYIGQFR